jgi:hypothetical protein
MAIEFNTSLGESDWDLRMGGWRCEALLIPSAKVSTIYYQGREADRKSYFVDRAFILWSGEGVPEEIVVKISLTQDLSRLEEEKNSLEREKLRLEGEKLTLEKEKARSENKWKFIAALTAVIGITLPLGLSYVSKQSPSSQPQSSTTPSVSPSAEISSPATAPSLPPLPTPPKLVSQKTVKGYHFLLENCKKDGVGLSCKLIIVNEQQDRLLKLNGTTYYDQNLRTRLTDELGGFHDVSEIDFSNTKQNGYVIQRLSKGKRYTATLIFKNFPNNLTKAQELVISINASETTDSSTLERDPVIFSLDDIALSN